MCLKQLHDGDVCTRVVLFWEVRTWTGFFASEKAAHSGIAWTCLPSLGSEGASEIGLEAVDVTAVCGNPSPVQHTMFAGTWWQFEWNLTSLAVDVSFYVLVLARQIPSSRILRVFRTAAHRVTTIAFPVCHTLQLITISFSKTFRSKIACRTISFINVTNVSFNMAFMMSDDSNFHFQNGISLEWADNFTSVIVLASDDVLTSIGSSQWITADACSPAEARFHRLESGVLSAAGNYLRSLSCSAGGSLNASGKVGLVIVGSVFIEWFIANKIVAS